MLISKHINVTEILEKYNILITGILHIGTNDCHEAPYYQNNMKISNDNTIWIDDMQHMVDDQEISIKQEYKVITKKLDTYLNEKSLNAKKYNFWNLNIQGEELNTLKGAPESIKYADAIYLEINENEVHKGFDLVEEIDCFLYSKGLKRIWTDMPTGKWFVALYVRVPKDIPVTSVMLRHDKRVFTDNLLYDNGIPPIIYMKKYGYEEPSYLEITNNRGLLIDKQCKKGKTALQYACEINRIDIVKMLLANNADRTINSDNGETLVGIAQKLGNLELMRILLAK